MIYAIRSARGEKHNKGKGINGVLVELFSEELSSRSLAGKAHKSITIPEPVLKIRSIMYENFHLPASVPSPPGVASSLHLRVSSSRTICTTPVSCSLTVTITLITQIRISDGPDYARVRYDGTDTTS